MFDQNQPPMRMDILQQQNTVIVQSFLNSVTTGQAGDSSKDLGAGPDRRWLINQQIVLTKNFSKCKRGDPTRQTLENWFAQVGRIAILSRIDSDEVIMKLIG